MTDILDLDGWTVLSKTTDPEGHDLLESSFDTSVMAIQGAPEGSGGPVWHLRGLDRQSRRHPPGGRHPGAPKQPSGGRHLPGLPDRFPHAESYSCEGPFNTVIRRAIKKGGHKDRPSAGDNCGNYFTRGRDITDSTPFPI